MGKSVIYRFLIFNVRYQMHDINLLNPLLRFSLLKDVFSILDPRNSMIILQYP